MSSVTISADGHVHEIDSFIERIPERYRETARPWFKVLPGGEGTVMNIHGVLVKEIDPGRELSDDENAREFRRDPSGGTDLARRRQDQIRDGVDAEVIFPNMFLGLGIRPDADFNLTVARTYNDWVLEVFAPEPHRYLPVGIIPVDDISASVGEAERCLAKGFRSLSLPCANAWRPYDRPEYEPLWSLFAEARVPVNFHAFTGNVAVGTDFSYLQDMTVEEFSERRAASPASDQRVEALSMTVIGMAAGMGPIVHLTGGGVLERHPELRFVVTEAECGWLAWTLHAMDAMQERRGLGMPKLPMRPSEYFKRQGAVTITDDPVGLRNLEFTGTDCIMWGNDYPHDEGTFPRSEKFREQIRAQVSADEAHAIFAGNAARVYGFDLGVLGG